MISQHQLELVKSGLHPTGASAATLHTYYDQILLIIAVITNSFIAVSGMFNTNSRAPSAALCAVCVLINLQILQ